MMPSEKPSTVEQPVPARGSAVSQLQRRDAPPEGIAPQIQFGGAGPGDSGSQALPDSEPGLRVTTVKPSYEVGQAVGICISWIAEDQSVTVRVLLPDGSEQQFEILALEPFEPDCFPWVVRPGDPLGQYQVVVRQGDQETASTFLVRAPTAPNKVVVPKDALSVAAYTPPSTVFQIILAGFHPRQRLALHLYLDGHNCQGIPCAGYYSSLPEVEMDEMGQAIYEVRTSSDDPPGSYHVVPEPQIILDGMIDIVIHAPLAVGQTKVLFNKLNLWTLPVGGERIEERPLLYSGSLLTILDIQPQAIQIRTEEGIEGWLHTSPGRIYYNLDEGDRVYYQKSDRPDYRRAGTRVSVVDSNGIPLRSEPGSSAAVVIDRMPPGQQGVVQELRGDWLRLVLDDGTTGWGRWYYDGNVYISSIP